MSEVMQDYLMRIQDERLGTAAVRALMDKDDGEALAWRRLDAALAVKPYVNPNRSDAWRLEAHLANEAWQAELERIANDYEQYSRRLIGGVGWQMNLD